MTFNLAPVGPTLPPVLYFRQPTLANPRPRLVDLTTFVPRAKGRGPEYRDEVRIFIGAYPHRDVPKVGMVVRRWKGFINKTVETDLYSVKYSGHKTPRGFAMSKDEAPLASSTMTSPFRSPDALLEIKPRIMSLETQASRIFDFAYTYSYTDKYGIKTDYTWRVSPTSRVDLTLWAYRVPDGNCEENDAENQMEVLVASYYGTMVGSEVDGVLEVEVDINGTPLAPVEEVVTGVMEVIRRELSTNSSKTSRKKQ